MDSTPLDEKFHAVLFDLDGVLTPTALIHMRAWQEMFNEELSRHQGQNPYTDEDYFAYVDGKPRYDGVRDFLASRGITLPEGDPSDGPAAQTICGLGNRKNDLFNTVLARDGIQPYPGSRRWWIGCTRVVWRWRWSHRHAMPQQCSRRRGWPRISQYWWTATGRRLKDYPASRPPIRT